MQRESRKKNGKVSCLMRLKAAVLGMAVLLITMAGAMPVFAMEAGSYVVTVRPSYTDPETGKVEDPGNNEAIGQGMTDRMCGSTGLLEIDESGNMYLTVRFYLSQFIKNITLEERTGSSYVSKSYQEMQTKAPVNGSSDISEKYGYTDYRLPINSMDSVFRGNAYIDAMGRSVVFFFTTSNPVKGNGDFVVSTQTAQPTQTEAAQAAVLENHAAENGAEQNDAYEPSEQAESPTTGQTDSNEDIFFVNGSGEVNDPVTGIPQKPTTSGTVTQSINAGASNQEITYTMDPETGVPVKNIENSQSVGEAKSFGMTEAYHLETVYDLSQVPLAQARKLTDPLLEEAVGITGMTGSAKLQVSAASMSPVGQESNPNKTIMLVLLGISALLAARFGFAMIKQQRIRRRDTYRSTSEHELAKNPDFQAAIAKLDAQYHAELKRLEQEYIEKQKNTEYVKNTGIIAEAQH